MHLAVGPDRHGVVRFGIELDEALRAADFHTRLTRCAPTDLDSGVHVQFTDRLFGRTAAEAATSVVALAAHAHAAGHRVTVTLHDLPQPSDGTHFAGRAEAYRRICAAVDAVVVSSAHEAVLLDDVDARPPEVVVIPLPLATPAPRPARPPAQPPSVGVFGYLYPGKGHDDVLAAMTGIPRNVWFMAIGEPSPGHDDLVESLSASARRGHRPFAITGHVPGHALRATLQAITVPVAHHRHVSASGSLNSWISAGRRPLTPIGRYTSEIAERNPGALLLYPDDRDGLASAITAALGRPESTWLPPSTVCEPTVAGAAQRYAEVLAAWHQ